MKKCVFALYHDINVDGRSAELLKCAMMIGKTTLVSYCPCINKPHELDEIIVANGKRDYVRYLIECKKIIKKEKPDFLFLENNYDAPLIKFAKKVKNSIKIVYDVSELYIGSPYRITNYNIPMRIRFKQKLSKYLSDSEAKSICLANVVTIPSRERALIFQGYHNLKKTPIVFDNMHRLNEWVDNKKYGSKYMNIFKDKFVLVYGGGIADSRYTFEICEAVSKLGNEYLLILCGAASKQELGRFNDWVSKNNVMNVKYYGMLKKDEWRYLIQNSHVTVSAYKFEEMNLIFCASGKVYEGLFEGKPLLASNNPPFENLCNQYGIGIATEDFSQGIVEIRNDYLRYCENVKQYINLIDYDGRVQLLKEQILVETNNDLNFI